jgi:hypothetical protein
VWQAREKGRAKPASAPEARMWHDCDSNCDSASRAWRAIAAKAKKAPISVKRR